MKLLNKSGKTNASPAIFLLKQRIGALYGMTAGFVFAVSSWGWDVYLLSKSHAYFPWITFITGAIFCVVFTGIVGWLAARSDNSLYGAIFWIVSSSFFAWLMVALPLQITPFIASKLDPQLGALLNYEKNMEFASRFWVSLMWITPFTLILGVTQLPITEPAVFSTSIFGKASPFFFCVIVMSISGAFTDNLINSHFRTAIVSLDATIQFVLDNKNNQNVDPARLRELHIRAFSTVEEYVQESRRLFVGSYDETLGDLHILVKFDNQWLDCNVMYGQPLFCKIAAGE